MIHYLLHNKTNCYDFTPPPPKKEKYTRAYLVLLLLQKNHGAKAAAICRHWNCTAIDTIDRHAWKSVVRATLCILHGASLAPNHTFPSNTARDRIESRKSTSKKN